MDEQPPPSNSFPQQQTDFTHTTSYTPPPVFRPTSTLAVWSLVNGLLGWIFCPIFCSMIAVVTGHMALGEIRRLDLDGKGIAIAGLALGYSMLGVALLCVLGMVLFFMVFAGIAATP